MSTRSSKRRTRRSGSRWDWYLLALLGMALVVLGSFVFFSWRQRGDDGVPEGDFAGRLAELAAQRGAGSGDIVADDPIRKIDGVFVRSWRITLPNRAALQAFEADVLSEVGRWQGRLTEGPEAEGAVTRMTVSMDHEAFDLRLAVSEPTTVTRQRPTKATRRPPTATPVPQPSPRARGRLAILLDDAGQSRDLLDVARALPDAVAVAVLPFLPHSADVANAMHLAGHEVWLHLPMEPQGYPDSDPGPGALLTSMSESEIRAAVHAALNNVPHVVGVNNHMGSRATAELRTMTWIMQELKARGIAFIDSRTTRRTVAEEAARAQGVPCNRRHVFLDNERSETAIRRQLAEAVRHCRMDGEAIAIGHLASVTVAVLEQELPTLAKRGADLVPPSSLVR